ncbi:MAG TPA: hypothetical protein VIV40_41965 [Kofleriaceae bacterium]
MKRLIVMCVVLASAVYVGCKQSDGDRCQVDDDCASMVCNKAKGTCAGSAVTGEIDASVPDGPDAALDAMTDAMADAP